MNKTQDHICNYQVTHRAENKMLNKSKIKNYLKKKEIKIVVILDLVINI